MAPEISKIIIFGSFLVFKTTDVQNICRELEAITGKDIKGKDSLLFLDEVQATPHALMALRYFFEEMPGIPIVAAGSHYSRPLR